MDNNIKEEIEEIIGQMQCSKDFICAKDGFEHLCKAKDFGLEKYLDCLDESPMECTFALSFANGYLCQCPLRVYISKKLRSEQEQIQGNSKGTMFKTFTLAIPMAEMAQIAMSEKRIDVDE